ncbi:hypothetical protein KY330_03380 [Candidatus Woesearchaeota archaeon]|nr:hypothetical protein [Candidatus Woesearchaeota archaeon]
MKKRDLIKKTVLVGIGFGALTKEKAEKAIARLQNEGYMNVAEGKKLASNIIAEAKKAEKKVMSMVDVEVKKALKKAYGKAKIVKKKVKNKAKKKIKRKVAKKKARKVHRKAKARKKKK